METENRAPEQVQEWCWCLVGNVVNRHEYGEQHIILNGSKQFRPGAKVYINLVFGGMGHENLLLIGMPRHSSQYIEIAAKRRNICNFRVQQVYKPAILARLKQSDYLWWDNSDRTHDLLVQVAERFNREAEEYLIQNE